MSPLGFSKWTGPRPNGHGGIESGYNLGPISQAGFLRSGLLIITFVTNTTRPALQRPGGDGDLTLHALVVDADAGKIVSQFEWPTSSRRSRLLPTPDGGFVVITPSRLLAYTPEFTQGTELRLGLEKEWDWWAIPSPSGAYLLLQSYRDRDAIPSWEEVDTASMRVVANGVKQSLVAMYGPADDGSIVSWDFTFPAEHPRILIRSPTGSVTDVWSPPLNQCDLNSPLLPVWGNFFMYGGERPYTNYGQQCLTLGSEAAGRPPLIENVDKHIFYAYVDAERNVALAAQAPRMAVAAATGVYHNSSKLTEIAVLDITTLRVVYAVDRGSGDLQLGVAALALSPDARRLAAIRDDGMLELFSLPGPSGDPSAGKRLK